MDQINGRTPALLFPHCFIDQDRLKGAIALFGSLEICLPWEKDFKTEPFLEKAAPFIEVLRPPEALKPGPGFGRLLAEYREWIRHNQDKSVLAFLSSIRKEDSSEDKSWEIRKRVRGERERTAAMPRENPSLKHHLVLHFAAEAEESYHTAESLIDVLKTSGSPLLGAIEAEEERPGLLDDLPSLKGRSLWQVHQWFQIVDAWLGLFDQHLKGRRILFSLDPRLPDFLKERFEKTQGEVPDRLFPEMITVKLPSPFQTPSMGELSKTGRKLFPPDVLERLDTAPVVGGGEGKDRAHTTLKDPLLDSLLGKVLVTMVS